MSKGRTYWFEAKTYGIGWGLPVNWQGWLTLCVFAGLLLGGLAGIESSAYRIVYGIVLAALFVAVVIWKGEKPVKWRWGRNR